MKTLLLALFTLSSLSAQAAAVQAGCSPSKELQRSTIRAKAGDTVIVFAPGNPSTGYSWQSKEGIKSTYNDHSRGMDGGGCRFPMGNGTCPRCCPRG